jgi:sugar O-acyltransferase (sialic acid O-acetyltransferase NeuD family)
MIIIGAGGHAKEILEVLTRRKELDNLVFFDNVNETPELFYGQFPIVNSFEELAPFLKEDDRFILGIGDPVNRHRLALILSDMGGRLTSLISQDSLVGSRNCRLRDGVNIMDKVFLSNDVHIGEGVLLNTGSQIHHDSHVGDYTEISPAALVLGKCRIGRFCKIGAGAVILSGVRLGDQVTIGAGAVVVKDVEDDTTAVGVPAKPIRS